MYVQIGDTKNEKIIDVKKLKHVCALNSKKPSKKYRSQSKN
jgi:hypothetical protein